jgi:catechol 2,3-dioxygenase
LDSTDADSMVERSIAPKNNKHIRNRIELFNTHYQCMDIDDEPVRWDASYAARRNWQLPARERWYTEASRFAGLEPREPPRKGNPMTLERYVAAK